LSVDRYANLIDNQYQQGNEVLVRNKLICFSTLKHVWPTIKLRSPVANRNALMLATGGRPTILLATLLISVTVDMKLKKPL